jgi:two-component system, OmpR family, sensor histidine kinase KdpD
MFGESPRSPRAQPLRLIGLTAGSVGLALLTVGLLPFRSEITPATPGLLYVLLVGVVAVLGGRVVALLVAVGAVLCFGVFFIPPFGSLRVQFAEDVVALVVFTVVALAVGTLVGREAARRRQAELREQEVVALHAEYARVVDERERLAVDAQRVEVLEEVDRQRSALLRSVSHDLRTPLATIATVMSGIRSGTPFDEATRAELLDLVADEVDRLDRLVSNLLSMSRIEAGALRPAYDSVDLAEIVDHAVSRLARLLSGRTVRTELLGLPSIPGDALQLDLVITNLLENAARFAPPGTPIEVTSSLQDDWVTVSVADHGPGIAPAMRPLLFEPFASGSEKRTGIGLATCRAIVEAHGGTISASDTPGGGACLTFALPTRH